MQLLDTTAHAGQLYSSSSGGGSGGSVAGGACGDAGGRRIGAAASGTDAPPASVFSMELPQRPLRLHSQQQLQQQYG